VIPEKGKIRKQTWTPASLPENVREGMVLDRGTGLGKSNRYPLCVSPNGPGKDTKENNCGIFATLCRLNPFWECVNLVPKVPDV
jgi:hypothetical protein